MEPKNSEVIQPKLTPIILWIMTIGSGLVVANNYYNQPLLAMMAEEFKVSERYISTIAMLTQIGYACGLLFIIPLGDKFKRKQMIQIDFIFIILSLFGMYIAPSVIWLFPLSFLIGFTSVIPQVFVPMAADLATPDRKASAVGMVMSGLLIGILLSRVISGYVGAMYGWRIMFLIASIIMIILVVVISIFLPEITPNYHGSYKGLMQSVWKLAKEEKVLQLASFRGATGFAAFSAFWTTLVFHMSKPPFYAGSDIVGMLGIIGVVGALSAVFVGRLKLRFSNYHIVSYSILLILVSWIIFYQFGNTYAGLIVGIIIIDLGLQSMHVMNQSAIFNIQTTASNRINTVYMTSYFIGGSLGTILAAQAWHAFQWNGVIAVGICFTILCLGSHLLYSKKIE